MQENVFMYEATWIPVWSDNCESSFFFPRKRTGSLMLATSHAYYKNPSKKKKKKSGHSFSWLHPRDTNNELSLTLDECSCT